MNHSKWTNRQAFRQAFSKRVHWQKSYHYDQNLNTIFFAYTQTWFDHRVFQPSAQDGPCRLLAKGIFQGRHKEEGRRVGGFHHKGRRRFAVNRQKLDRYVWGRNVHGTIFFDFSLGLPFWAFIKRDSARHRYYAIGDVAVRRRFGGIGKYRTWATQEGYMWNTMEAMDGEWVAKLSDLWLCFQDRVLRYHSRIGDKGRWSVYT